MNFFLPSLKLAEKWRERSHWRKRYEPAQTAYQRLMQSPKLPRKTRRELRDQFESLDPFALKQDVEKRLKKILGGADVASRPSGGSAPLHRPKGTPPQGGDTSSTLNRQTRP